MPSRTTTTTFSLDDLGPGISSKFDEAQASVANHRKNCVALHKIHVQAAKVVEGDELSGEERFGDVFIDMINRTLAVKKGAFADRVVRFVGSYVKMMNDKIMESRPEEVGEGEEETFASRFVVRLLEWIFQGFKAKNKITRQRSIQLVTEMMANIGEIDEGTYNFLRDNLIGRLCDKEPSVRANAAVALSKLIGTESPDDLRKGEYTCLELLLDCVRHDPAAEVRRAALVNLPVTPETLPIIITRTRDTDTIMRKLTYATVLEPKLDHPRQLTIAQREEITKVGLGDREAAVRVAAGKMIAKWMDIAMEAAAEAAGQVEGEGQQSSWTGDDGGVMKAFIHFLSFFDVVGPGEAVAVDAMLCVFTTKPGLLDAFVFSDEFWTDLTPESAVLARVFVDQCLEPSSSSKGGENRLEMASIPVVTAFAFHIQEAYNALLSLLQEADLLDTGDADDEESEAREEELAKRELILGELLRIALKLDYMDEIGRRKVFCVVKDMLAHPQLPPGLIERCLDVLCKIVDSERELIRIVVEIIIELRDDEAEANVDDDIASTFDASHSDITQTTFSRKERSMRRTKERHEMTLEEQQRVDVTDLRCLLLCIGMLERVHGTFEDNSTLEGVLTDLIIPAVKRKELTLREKGLVSLGLCCLIARQMATNSFQLFLSQVQSAPEDLKLKVLQIVFDLLVVYEKEFLGRSEEKSNQIMSFILQTLDAEESSAVQSVLCIGICKLLLSGQVTDSRVLLSLVLTYISPSSADNVELKQCLAYFFPVYCYSSRENQGRMQSIFMEAFDLASKMHEELEDEQKIISPHQFGLLMIDWTDQEKLVERVPPPRPGDRNPHADLALDVLLALYDSEDRNDENRKLLCQFLTQLQLFSSTKAGPELDTRIILKLNILVENLQAQVPLDNAALDKIFNRFKEKYRKTFQKRLDKIDPGRYVDEDFKKFYDDIGMEVPEATGDPVTEEEEAEDEAEEGEEKEEQGDGDEEIDEEEIKQYVEEGEQEGEAEKDDGKSEGDNDGDGSDEGDETLSPKHLNVPQSSGSRSSDVTTLSENPSKKSAKSSTRTSKAKAGPSKKPKARPKSPPPSLVQESEMEEDEDVAVEPHSREEVVEEPRNMEDEDGLELGRSEQASSSRASPVIPIHISPMKKASKRTRAPPSPTTSRTPDIPISPARKRQSRGRAAPGEREASPTPPTRATRSRGTARTNGVNGIVAKPAEPKRGRNSNNVEVEAKEEEVLEAEPPAKTRSRSKPTVVATTVASGSPDKAPARAKDASRTSGRSSGGGVQPKAAAASKNKRGSAGAVRASSGRKSRAKNSTADPQIEVEVEPGDEEKQVGDGEEDVEKDEDDGDVAEVNPARTRARSKPQPKSKPKPKAKAKPPPAPSRSSRGSRRIQAQATPQASASEDEDEHVDDAIDGFSDI